MRPRVLVVDDEEINLVLLATKFERVGYEVERARDGIEALKKVQTAHPDIILLDVMMPRMDGYETLRRLKSNEETRYIPVIMLTGKAEVEDKVMGLEVGAEDYISKPYSLQEVAARVKSLLRMRVLQTRLRETEKMAALGEMVDGIAHEIRNPLMAMGGMARRLQEHETDPQHKEYAERIIKSVERLERMLHRVDEYKKILVSTLSPGDINSVIAAAVRDATEFMENEGKEISIKTHLLPELPAIKMDAGNLRVAIFNVIQNSIEAIEKKGEINIDTKPTFDNTLVLTVTDTGCGIDKDELRKIFNPFQTSKFQGAGLGLTIAYRIIHDHGAEIEVQSTQGKGTTVTMKFNPVRKPAAVRHGE